MAQQLHLFASAVRYVGEIKRGSYTGQEHTQIASDDLCKQLQSVQACDKVKAVMLRVDSPGGSPRHSRHTGCTKHLLFKIMAVNSVQCNGQVCSSLGVKHTAFLASTLALFKQVQFPMHKGHVAERTCKIVQATKCCHCSVGKCCRRSPLGQVLPIGTGKTGEGLEGSNTLLVGWSHFAMCVFAFYRWVCCCF